MAKTAGQLVPLKTQLAPNMALFRFADATTDFAGNVAYQDYQYDNTGAANLTPNGLSGVGAISQQGSALPTALSTPGALSAPTVNNSASSGVSRHGVLQRYYVGFYDSSNRESQPMIVDANIPATTSGSVTFNFSWPAGATGAYIYKMTSSSGGSRITIGNGVGSITDNTAMGSLWQAGSGNSNVYQTGTGVGYYYWTVPSPNGSSTAPTMSSSYCNVVFNTTGGSFRGSSYGYCITAYNALGETLANTEADATPLGVPVISGAASGQMNTITLAAATTSGTLPAAKYYYKVTAYTGFSQNSWSSNGGVGQTESLPSAEANVTLSATGQVTVSWTAVANANGYGIYRSQDLVNPTATTTSTATTGGTIPASTTYYYVVTATNANGETMASNEVSQATGSGTGTNTITVNWQKVNGAYGYRVYRGTATGAENTLVATIASGGTLTWVDTGVTGSAASLPVSNTATGNGLEAYLATVATGAATSYIDAGGQAQGQNTGFTPPQQYNGSYGPASVALSWSPPTTGTPVGYYVYRGQYGQANAGTSLNYWNVTGTTTWTDTGQGATGTKYVPTYNLAGTGVIASVGRYMKAPAGLANNSIIRRIGATASLNPTKQYRFRIWDQSNQVIRWTGSWFTPPNSAFNYYEDTPNLSMSTWQNNFVWYFLEGADNTSTIVWQPALKPSSGDYPNTVQSENGTWVSTRGSLTMNNTYVLGGATDMGGWSPVQVLTEATGGSFPMNIVWSNLTSGSTINGTAGTFLGGTRTPQYAYSPNTTYATPVKSIVPSWSLYAPTSLLYASTQGPLYASRWVPISVSTDGGTTWSALTQGQRFVFPSPATQLQFRYTVPGQTCAMSFDRRLMSGLPATDSSYVGAYNYYFNTDTGKTGYYYQQNNNNNDAYFTNNGNFRLGTTYSDWQYNFWSIQNFSVDVDQSCLLTQVTGGNCGLRFRNDGSANSYGGYYAYIDSNGNAGLTKANYAHMTWTTVASVTGSHTAGNGLQHLLRVICVGQHIMFFVNGRLVIDYTDTAQTGNYATGTNVGLSGGNGYNINGWWATALTTAYAQASPSWELEYLAAYLET